MAEPHYSRESTVRAGQTGLHSGNVCAYNLTRQRFLCAQVDTGDFANSGLEARLLALTPSAGAGLWMMPFRGISPTSVRVPIDLVYLDQNCMVLDVVESFPFSSVSSSSRPAASVLALPLNTIASAGVFPGDKLALGTPDEMKQRLASLMTARAETEPEPGSALAADAARGAAGRVLQFVDRTRPKPAVEEQPVEMAPIVEPYVAQPEPQQEPVAEPAAGAPRVAEPAQKKAKKGWLERLLSPEPPQPRKAARECVPGISAYFFTGGDPVSHGIRDMSATGMYLLTEERWYPGTVIRMTLTDRRQPGVDRSITVNAGVVRWGNDGVGLQFVFQDAREQRLAAAQMNGMVGGASKAQVEQFMKVQ